MRIKKEYLNGNSMITVYESGTRIRTWNDEVLRTDFPDLVTIFSDGDNKKLLTSDFYLFIFTLSKNISLKLQNLDISKTEDIIQFLTQIRYKDFFITLRNDCSQVIKNIDFVLYLLSENLIDYLDIELKEGFASKLLMEYLRELPNEKVSLIADISKVSVNTVKGIKNEMDVPIIIDYNVTNVENFKFIEDWAANVDYVFSFDNVRFSLDFIKEFNLIAILTQKFELGINKNFLDIVENNVSVDLEKNIFFIKRNFESVFKMSELKDYICIPENDKLLQDNKWFLTFFKNI